MKQFLYRFLSNEERASTVLITGAVVLMALGFVVAVISMVVMR